MTRRRIKIKALRNAKISIRFGSVRFQTFLELPCDCGSVSITEGEVDCQPVNFGADEERELTVVICALLLDVESV